jgi:4-azaleucine resistance transporter AzlC
MSEVGRTPPPEGQGERRRAFLDGVRLGVGPGAAAFVLALTYGSAAVAEGWGITAPVVFSMFGFSGSAQFTLLAALSSGSVLAGVTAALLINARYVVMSVALNDSLHGGRLRRVLVAQTLVDASFVVAHRGHGRFDVPRLIGASVPQWVLWVSGTLIGAVLSPPPDLAYTLGLDVAFPAFFLLLALGELRGSRRASAAALLGAAITAGLLLVTNPGLALLGASLAVLVGVRGGSVGEGREGEVG